MSDHNPQPLETLEASFENADTVLYPDTDVAQLEIELSLLCRQTTVWGLLEDWDDSAVRSVA